MLSLYCVARVICVSCRIRSTSGGSGAGSSMLSTEPSVMVTRNTTEGDASVKTLSLKDKVEGIDLFAHIGRVVDHDLALDVEHAVSHDRLIGDVERDLHFPGHKGD